MKEQLQNSDRRKIERLYLSGVKPTEIARRVGMKPASLRQHLYREGLTKRRDEIEAVKQRTAREVLESIRQKSVEDYESVLGLLSEGMKIDAKKLRDGWSMVDDAAGASSLMRAKAMLQNQALRFYGTEKEEEAPPAHFDLSLFMLPSFKGIRRVDEVEAEKKAKEQQKPPLELV
jgi:AraC-like DNA-binding protein